MTAAPPPGPAARRRASARAALALGALVAAAFAATYAEFLAGRYVYAYTDSGGDTVNQYLPRLLYLAGPWREAGRPAWSFREVLGNRFDAALRTPLADPFYRVVLLAARAPERIAGLLAWMSALKALAAAAACYRFLRAVRAARFPAVAASLVYAFGGYFVLLGQHYHLGTACVAWPLVLWGFERYRARRDLLVLPLAVAFASLSAYRLYTVAPVLGLFALLRGVTPSGDPPPRARLRGWLGLVALCVLGVAIGGSFSLPSLHALLLSPRVTGAVSGLLRRAGPAGLAGFAACGLAAVAAAGALAQAAWDAAVRAWAGRPAAARRAWGWAALAAAVVVLAAGPYVAQHLLGRAAHHHVFNSRGYYLAAGSRLLGNEVPWRVGLHPLGNEVPWRVGLHPSDWWNLYVDPHLYAGLLVLVLAPFAFARLPAPRRPAYVAGLLAAAFAVVYPVASFALTGFSAVYYRWTFVLLPFAAWHLAVALGGCDLGRVRPRAVRAAGLAVALLGAGVVAGVSAVAQQAGRGTPWPWDSLARVAVAAAGLGLLAARLAARPRSPRWRAALLAALAAEAVWASRPVVQDRARADRPFLAALRAHLDRVDRAVAELRARDPGFFRIEKDFAQGIYREVEPLLLREFFPTGGFVSLPSPHVVAFYRAMGLVYCSRGNENCIHGIPPDRPLVQGLVGVRYLLHRGPGGPPDGYERVAEPEGLPAFRNRWARPLGFVCTQAVARAAFDALPPASRDRLLHHAVVLEDGDAAPPGVAAADAGALAAAPPDAAPPEAPALEVTEFREDRIAGQVAGGRPGLLFVSIPYDADWRAEVDGRPVRPWRVNIGFLGIAWPAGARELRLEFVPRTVLLGRAMTAAGFAAWGLLAVGRIRRRG